jgi:transposase InsO family protein
LRIRAALEIEQGLIVNTKLVKRIMRQLGIRGLPGPRKGVKNLKNAPTCEDLVQRNFKAEAPNELWLTDITEHETQEGKLYCCVVLDMYSRKVVGWAIDRRCETVLVNDASKRPAPRGRRRPRRSSIRTTAVKVNSTGRRNTSIMEVCNAQQEQTKGDPSVSRAHSLTGKAGYRLA